MNASTGEAVLFWVLGPVMVIAALALLFSRKAVHAAFAVMVVMASFAVLYIAQEAPFLGVVQIVVYTGAVMMLFLFVLMLVGVDTSDSLVETIKGQRWIAIILGLGLGVVLITTIGRVSFKAIGLAQANAQTNPAAVAEVLFSKYVFAMEIVGTLLITAALAALILTHRRRLVPKVTQGEMAAAKVAAVPTGGRLTPLAAPGVYAQNNAMDTPALDPQGRPIEESVSRILRIRGQERSAAQVFSAGREVLALHEPERARRVMALAEPEPEPETRPEPEPQSEGGGEPGAAGTQAGAAKDTTGVGSGANAPGARADGKES